IDKEENVEQLFFTYNELINYPTPQDKNIYVGIYERNKKGSGRIDNCTRSNAIYLDFDNVTLDEIMFKIDMKNLPQPSMTIGSGNGYHLYWILDKPAGHELKPIIEALANKLNADTGATDIARVLRVPDTMNVKD